MHPMRNRPAWMVWLSWLLLFVLAFPGCVTEPQPDREAHGPHPIRSVPADAVLYLNDHQGSPVVVTNARGEVVRETTLHPYGSVRAERGTPDDPFAYVGNERDPGSGLHDFRARPYRPTASVFLAPDPVAVFSPEQVLEEPGRLSAYGYGSGDSVNHTDPDGELWGAIAVGVALAVGITFASEYANAPTLVDPSTKHRGTAGLAIEAAAIAITAHGAATGGVGLVQGALSLGKRFLGRAATRLGLGKSAAAASTPAPAATAAESVGFADQTYYRCMSEAEAKAVRETGRLRGGDPGATFFTDTKFRTASRAQDRLSLQKPLETQMKFRITGNPTPIRNGTRIKPQHNGRGGAREYSTADPVEVEVINVQPFAQ